MTEIFHYVYRITNTVENKHYYGKRSSKCEPKEDLGKKYFSSSCDSKFRKDQKENPQNYRYKIVQTFKDPISAIAREVKLHSKFDVAVNAKFYNRSKQTNIKFDTTGTIGPNLGKPSKYKGIPRSKEILDKISKSRTGIKLTEKHKSAIAKSLIGHKQSEETKDKKSKATKGIPKSEEHKKKISVANKGKKEKFRK